MTDTIKKPRLFYWEDTENAWCPADGLLVENIIPVDWLADGETASIRFKCIHMTDEEFDNIPES